jgi:hypothetical protein
VKNTFLAIFSILLIVSCNTKKNEPVKYKLIHFETNIPLVEGSKDNIHYHVAFKFTELTDYYNDLALKSVKKELNRLFFNAEKLEFSSKPKENFKTLIKAITPAYREEGLKLKNEMQEMSYLLNYELIKSSRVIYNKNEVLIIEIESYVFAGGAHGMGNKQYLHFDMKSGKEFKLDEVFGHKAKERLNKLLLNKGEEIKKQGNSVLFEDAKAELNENYYFDKNNFYFVYNPYEIGPYASGYISIPVSIESIKELITKDGPLGFLAN